MYGNAGKMHIRRPVTTLHKDDGDWHTDVIEAGRSNAVDILHADNVHRVSPAFGQIISPMLSTSLSHTPCPRQ